MITLLAVTGRLTPEPFAWRPHPEVWLMIAALGLMYFYVTRVIGPKAVPKGTPIITKKQSRWFFFGLFVLWLSADWPMHDIAEDYLYSVHMVQHLLMTWVVPPAMLFATPEWFARLVLGRGRVYKFFKFMTLPLVAGILYNTLYALTHVPSIVNDSVRSPGFHFFAHVTIMISAFLMWTCVFGPLQELRRSVPVQCIYLFLMSVLPTVPGGWLVFAQTTVYEVYDHPWPTLWGLSPAGDQQLAGFIMKVLGGLYLWSIIMVRYFRWSRQLQTEKVSSTGRHSAQVAEKRKAMANALSTSGHHSIDGIGDLNGEVLTFEEVQEAFERSEPMTPEGPEP